MAENSDSDCNDDKDCTCSDGGRPVEEDADVPDLSISSVAGQKAEERDAETLPVHFHLRDCDCEDEGNGRNFNCHDDIYSSSSIRNSYAHHSSPGLSKVPSFSAWIWSECSFTSCVCR